MSKRLALIVALFLAAASAAHAQYGGGGMGGGGMGGGGMGGGHGGRGRHSKAPPSNPAPAATAPAPAAAKPVSSIEIVGVIKAIDPNAERVTIAYEDVPALSWPAGTMPFAVSKSELLKGASVGEKVRFTLDSQQIATLRAY